MNTIKAILLTLLALGAIGAVMMMGGFMMLVM